MNLLQVVNTINAELASLRAYHPDILEEEERSAIFNSLVSSITGGSVDAIKVSIVDRHSPGEERASWTYDLADTRFPRRSGPTLREVLEFLRYVPEGAAAVLVSVERPESFRETEPRDEERSVGTTIRSDAAGNGQLTPLTQTELPRAAPEGRVAVQSDDSQLAGWQELESDLRRLEAKTKIIRREAIKALRQDIETLTRADYIRAVSLRVVEKGRGVVLAEWRHEIGPNRKVTRIGDTLEHVLEVIKHAGRSATLVVSPAFTERFALLSPGDQQGVLRSTIWSPTP